MDDRTDRKLVVRARRGDRSACEELARRHRKPAYFFALQLLGDPDDAFDVAQDAMLRFFTHLDRFDPPPPGAAVALPHRAQPGARPLPPAQGAQARFHRRAADDDERPDLQLIDETMDPEGDARDAQLRRTIFAALAS